MSLNIKPPQLDPFAPGVRAADVPVSTPAPGIRFPEISPAIEGWPAPDAPMVEFALYYARRGWHVFPCGRKKPLTARDRDANGEYIDGTGGFYKATTDESQIRAWWKEWLFAMIGVRAGEASGVFAIDPDGEVGIANWNEIVVKNSSLPQTHMHITPGGGQHLIFRWRADRPITTSPGQLKGLKIDVKGQGGYFIAPPSVGKNGKRYQIADQTNFFNFAEAPEWLYAMLQKPEESIAAPSSLSISQQAIAMIRPRDGFDDLIPSARSSGTNHAYIDGTVRGVCSDLVRMAPGEGRNIALNNAAVRLGHFVAGGELDEQRVFDELLGACMANGVLTADGKSQCLATIRSGLRKGKQEPQRAPEPTMSANSTPADTVTAPDVGAPGNLVYLNPKPAQSLAMAMTLFDDVESFIQKDWLLKGAIAKGETSLWIAPPGRLKSALMTDISICLASGVDWRGYRSRQKCGVVYFALERGDLVKRRTAAHKKREGLTGLPIAIVPGIINLMDPRCVGIIVETIRDAEKRLGCPVGFAAFDTLAKGIAAGGGDENQAKDLGAALANLRRAQELTGAHIAIISHTGKDEKRGARGSNSQDGDVDVVIQISGDGEIKVATVTKANDQKEGVLTKFKGEIAELGVDNDGDAISTMIISLDDCGSADGKSETKAKLNDTERRAMDMLYNALNDTGKDAPPAGGFPYGVKVVPVDIWRTACKRGGLSKGETDSAFRKAFNRVSIALANKGKIGLLDDMVWVAYDS